MYNTNDIECPICGGKVIDEKCCACGYIRSNDNSSWRIEREKYVDAKELNQDASAQTGFEPVETTQSINGFDAGSFYQNPSAPIPLCSTNKPIQKESHLYIFGTVLAAIVFLGFCSLIMLVFSAVSVVAVENNYVEVSSLNTSYDYDSNNDVNSTDDYNSDSDGSTVTLSEETLRRYGYYYGTMSDFIVDKASKIVIQSDELKNIEYVNENPQAYDFMDCVPGDLTYTITRNYYHYNNEDGFYNDSNNLFPEMLVFDSSYIEVSGTDSINEAGINEALLKESAKCVEIFDEIRGYLYEDSTFRVSVNNYVTHADNETISVLQCITAYIIRNGEEYRYYIKLSGINIDIKLAKVIDSDEVLSISKEFYSEFASKCEKQNGSAVSMSSEELVTLFADGRYVWVYTPLGVEIGVNYGEYSGEYSGFSTCTYTDLSEIIKGY